tara:strand:- start:415 stop:1506 length:1092 start_codon:yes stop_codon:yes gene_type:complete
MKHALIVSVLTVLMILPATAQRRRTAAPVLGRSAKPVAVTLQDNEWSIIKIGLGLPDATVQGWPGQGTMSSPFHIVFESSTASGGTGRRSPAFQAKIQLSLRSDPSDLYGIWITLLEKPNGATNTAFQRIPGNGNLMTKTFYGLNLAPFGLVRMDELVEGLYKLELKGRYKDGSFGDPKNIWIRVTYPTIQVRLLYHLTDRGNASTAVKLAGRGTAIKPFRLTGAQASQDGWLVTGGTVTDPGNIATEVCVVKENSQNQNFLKNVDINFQQDHIPTPSGNFRHSTREHYMPDSGRVFGASTPLPKGLHKLHVRFYRFKGDTGVQTGQTLYLKIEDEASKPKKDEAPKSKKPVRSKQRPRERRW